ncbi:MarR family winged helix-turn-helix transcriptional regulator [Alloalcanivorax balearicus]|nr:MarR family transcriptional regulator [Alloalcanivorax balearicus]
MGGRDTTVGMSLNDVARMMRRDFDRRAREQGLSRARWQVLWQLSRRQGVHQAALAEVMDLAPISLTRQLDQLEAEGLVERRPDPSDRRRRLLFLADQARPALERLKALAEQTRARAFAGLEPADIDTLIRILAAMRANLCDRPDQGD